MAATGKAGWPLASSHSKSADAVRDHAEGIIPSGGLTLATRREATSILVLGYRTAAGPASRQAQPRS